MKHSIKTKISLTIAFAVLTAVCIVSFLANYFIENQFNNYISREQKQKIEEIITSVSQQYNADINTFNEDIVHTIGMSALYNGYILKIKDENNNSVWDAYAHDMSMCKQVMNDISIRMEKRYPDLGGKITLKTFDITAGGEKIGTADIIYFGPFFLDENDFKFLDSLKTVLIIIAFSSLLFSIVLGILMAKRLSKPILKTINAAKHISDGNYKVRIDESSNTKELQNLIQSVNNIADSLQKQEKLRKQLTEDISHELRTPIAVLQSHIEAMTEGIWPVTTQRLISCGEDIKRISSLVGELEKLAKIENSNELKKTKVNVREIIEKIIKGFEFNINNKNLTVTLKGECSDIFADKDKLGRVFINLMSNSIKYTKNGGQIDINLYDYKDSVVITFKDDGIGIEKDELEYIFERFYRTEKSRSRETGGSGLGLAIAKSIVEAHRGKISAQSEINAGSIFKTVLPKN